MKPLLAIFNIFIDPAEAVNNMEGRFAWVWPFLLACIVGIFVAISTTPIVLQVMRVVDPIFWTEKRGFLDGVKG